MSYPTYTPARWVIVRITNKATSEVIDKVFGGWGGGYTHGDSWKLNSGIKRIEQTDEYYLFYGYSGSVYQCYKSSEGMSTYMQFVYNSFLEDFPDNYSIEIIPVTEIL